MKNSDRAYQAGKKRVSPRTGFVHGYENFLDTIPLYDNFCFAYALLSQRKTETILEAKNLLIRLLAFQASTGNFPNYLHDYPFCYDQYMGLKIAPLLIRSVNSYGQVLGVDCKNKIETALLQIFHYYEDQLLPPLWEYRLKVCLQQQPDQIEVDVEDRWEHWISQQFNQTPICDFYFDSLGIIPSLAKQQNRYEPVAHLMEWACASAVGSCPSRLAQEHPMQVQLAGLEKVEVIHAQSCSYLLTSPFKLYWQDGSLHSLIIDQNVPDQLRISDHEIYLDLTKDVEFGREDLYELSFFCDASAETKLYIDGKKGTAFELGQQVEISTPNFSIQLRFTLFEGEGDFCGQIVRSNRSSQIACIGLSQFEAYDWKIGLRTLRRSSKCTIKIVWALFPLTSQ